MEELNWKHGFTQRDQMDTNTERVRQIMNESYLTTKSVIDKAVNLQSNLNDKDSEIKKAKSKIIDSILKLDNATDDETTVQAEQVIKTILSKYPFLSSYVSHVRTELK